MRNVKEILTTTDRTSCPKCGGKLEPLNDPRELWCPVCLLTLTAQIVTVEERVIKREPKDEKSRQTA
jgi:predicted amidophosphoribosyltransferase